MRKTLRILYGLFLFAPLAAQAQTFSIVYSRVPNGIPDGTVWIAASDGSSDQQITTGEWPRISPDGNSILFHRGLSSDPSRNHIFVRDVPSGNETDIFANFDFAVFYDWTADSSQIVFDFGCGIYAMNPDGSNIVQLIGADCFDDAPALNPVDGTIAFHNAHVGLLLANPDGSNRTVIPNTMPPNFWSQWSPDGQWISFGLTDVTDALSIVNFYTIRPDGSGLTQLTFQSDPDRFGPVGAWTSDGSTIVAPGNIGGVQGLYAIATDGSGTMTLLPTAPGDPIAFVGSVVGP